ncbi:hypothetical protein BKA65DRAFT_540601 [Rhexocercosporidium sp. MPI-PUGE-AT-0058]|nr:hypothetical protein BKA65DRAFT_540601 [Rhexocercosporidium sp. MPI-PUGE-AT-0058]
MKLHTAALTLLSSLALAAAMPVDNDDLAKRDKPNGALCQTHQDANDSSFYRLYTWGVWDQDWGQGLLDNLRGQCFGNINDWKFNFESGVPPTNGVVTFWINSEGGGSKCVQDAIWLASNGAGGAIWDVKCYYQNF